LGFFLREAPEIRGASPLEFTVRLLCRDRRPLRSSGRSTAVIVRKMYGGLDRLLGPLLGWHMTALATGKPCLSALILNPAGSRSASAAARRDKAYCLEMSAGCHIGRRASLPMAGRDSPRSHGRCRRRGYMAYDAALSSYWCLFNLRLPQWVSSLLVGIQGARTASSSLQQRRAQAKYMKKFGSADRVS
jgi:hypothetical protein